MPESLDQLNISIKDYFLNTDPNEIKLFSIMNLLNQAGFVENVYQANRGKTLALKLAKSAHTAERTLGTIVTETDGDGIAKVRVEDKTSLTKPPGWRAMTQAAEWIFKAYTQDSNIGPLLTFAILDEK